MHICKTRLIRVLALKPRFADKSRITLWYNTNRRKCKSNHHQTGARCYINYVFDMLRLQTRFCAGLFFSPQPSSVQCAAERTIRELIRHPLDHESFRKLCLVIKYCQSELEKVRLVVEQSFKLNDVYPWRRSLTSGT